MTSAEQRFTAVLSTIAHIGPATIERLLAVRIESSVSLITLWDGGDAVLQDCLQSQQWTALVAAREGESWQARWERWHGAMSIYSIFDEAYPSALREIYRPPIVLFLREQAVPRQRLDLNTLLGPLPVAVVGTRSMTRYGKESAEYLVADLLQEGASCIVSGFMYGVDTVAQRVAIRCGGRSIGVLGYGFNHLEESVPPAWLTEYEAGGGRLLSEYPPETPAVAGRFVARNRIVAGMSQATLVVEAGERSGSHITAKLALENGRTVGAVPGPIGNQYSEGTKALINEGAVVVSRGLDLLNSTHPLY